MNNNESNCFELKGIINEYIQWKSSNIKQKITNPLLSQIISFLSKNESTSQLSQLDLILSIINDYTSTFQIPLKQASMSLLLDIITELKSSLFPDSLGKIIPFIKKTLKDITCVPFSVKILFYLYTQYPSIQKEITNIVLITYTGESLNIPAYTQETRQFALQVLEKIIIEQKLNKSEQIQLLSVVYDCIDGEKDPRNLLIAFKIIKELFINTPRELSDNFANNYFEFLNEYYPIDFTPPKDIKNPITAKQLSKAINEVMCLENFGSFFFNNLNEYGISSVGDIMITIQSICSSYSKENLNKYYGKIMDFIINSIENTDEETIHIESLITLTTFLKHYSPYDDQIDKSFNLLSDKIFSEEEIKTSYDSKDILCSIIEYDVENKFLEKTINLIIKLISLFIFRKTNFHFLKNANSLLFFALKKYGAKGNKNLPQNIVDILTKNKQMIMSLNTNFSVTENNINSIPINNLLNTFICIVDIVAAIAVKTNILSKEEIKEIYDNIIEKFFNIKIESEKDLNHLSYCICEICNKYNIIIYESIFNKFKKNDESQKCVKILQNLLKISNETTQKAIFDFFITNIENRNIQNVFIHIVKEDYSSFDKIIKELSSNLEQIVLSNITNKDYYDLISTFIQKDTLMSNDKMIKSLLNNLCQEHSIKLIKECIKKGIKNDMADIIYNELKRFYFEKGNNITNNQKKKICKCIYVLLPYSTITKEEVKKDFDNIGSELSNNSMNDLPKNGFTQKEIYLSQISNFLIIKTFNTTNNEELDSIIKTLFDLISEPAHQELFEETKLFKIKNIPPEIKDYLLIKLKPYISNKQFLRIILNVYSSSNDDIDSNDDILFTLYSKCISSNINMKGAIFQLRKILIRNVDNLQFKRINCNDYYQIINKIIEFFNNKDNVIEMKTKIEGLKLIGVIKDFINDEHITEEHRKKIIIPLRKMLGDIKRPVRKFCGIVINIWNMIE